MTSNPDSGTKMPHQPPFPSHCWCGEPVALLPGMGGHHCRQCHRHCALEEFYVLHDIPFPINWGNDLDAE